MNKKVLTIINNKIKALQGELKKLEQMDAEFKAELTKIHFARVRADAGIKILNQVLEEGKQKCQTEIQK